jgi:hypothetical protein
MHPMGECPILKELNILSSVLCKNHGVNSYLSFHELRIQHMWK